MKIISHRGNISGPDHSHENTVEQIQKCIDLGYDVEIDLRMRNGAPHLGHDSADHEVAADWLRERQSNLWIHVKEYSALVWLMSEVPTANFFCHESDRYTLVSNGKVWCHDLTNVMTDKCVIPLLSLEQVQSYDFKNQGSLYAVCTDYVRECERAWGRND